MHGMLHHAACQGQPHAARLAASAFGQVPSEFARLHLFMDATDLLVLLERLDPAFQDWRTVSETFILPPQDVESHEMDAGAHAPGTPEGAVGA